MTITALCRTALLSALLLTPEAFARQIERTFNASPGGTLEVQTQTGSIHVQTHDRNEILVDIEIEGDDEDDFSLEFEHEGDDLTIIGEKESTGSGWWGGNRLRASFTITVPRTFDLDLHTAGGRIETEDLKGDVYARTSGGSIIIGNIEGDVDLRTSGGSIRTEDIVGEIDAHTSGGSIDVTFAKQLTQDATLRTSGGSIKARLPEDVQIDLDASTSGGRVTTEFNVDGRIKKRSIDGEINGGGPRLTLQTSGGSVRVDKI
ncbi:DUF4097 family beta strand repeat-containing protein [Alteromonas halophila]|uniref:DUF4097 domain-containing protein n=1 Tax=Alteromonas halophila TaxID=516698 RepID=A0A918JQP3_9ALTE|nr:DUF4097 family beta strand repeat-containing protein [Alteromonas halophila]GGW96464.1 hypothetical protein GCM10007391_33230 [Alteromonas halophila]